jgi:hypothetical protein
MGARKTYNSGTAFRFEVPEANSPQTLHGFQIGGTSVADQKSASLLLRVRHADF